MHTVYFPEPIAPELGVKVGTVNAPQSIMCFGTTLKNVTSANDTLNMVCDD